MKRFCLLFGFILLSTYIFTACTKKDITKYNYTYKGEDEFWNVEYEVNCTVISTYKDGIKVATASTNVLSATYKGELTDLSSVRHMEIIYESSTHSGTKISDYDDGNSISSKTFTIKSSGKNNAIPNENDIIKVTINIDGDKHNLELKNNQ